MATTQKPRPQNGRSAREFDGLARAQLGKGNLLQGSGVIL